MQYKSFQEMIVDKYEIDIVGWPTGIKFAPTSELSDSIGPLEVLRDALVNDECKFVRITNNAQMKRRRDKTAAERAAGIIPPKHVRKVRSDCRNGGSTRVEEDGVNSGEEDDESDDLGEGTSSSVQATSSRPKPRKRARKQ